MRWVERMTWFFMGVCFMSALDTAVKYIVREHGETWAEAHSDSWTKCEEDGGCFQRSDGGVSDKRRSFYVNAPSCWISGETHIYADGGYTSDSGVRCSNDDDDVLTGTPKALESFRQFGSFRQSGARPYFYTDGASNLVFTRSDGGAEPYGRDEIIDMLHWLRGEYQGGDENMRALLFELRVNRALGRSRR